MAAIYMLVVVFFAGSCVAEATPAPEGVERFIELLKQNLVDAHLTPKILPDGYRTVDKEYLALTGIDFALNVKNVMQFDTGLVVKIETKLTAGDYKVTAFGGAVQSIGNFRSTSEAQLIVDYHYDAATNTIDAVTYGASYRPGATTLDGSPAPYPLKDFVEAASNYLYPESFDHIFIGEVDATVRQFNKR